MKHGGEILVFDNNTLVTLIEVLNQVIEKDMVKSQTFKRMTENAKDSLVSLSTKMAVLKKSRCYVRIATSPEATHNGYFECVTITKDGKLTKGEALAESLNLVLYQSKEEADVELVSENETDRNFEFVVKVKQY